MKRPSHTQIESQALADRPVEIQVRYLLSVFTYGQAVGSLPAKSVHLWYLA